MFWCSTFCWANVGMFNILLGKCFECFKNRSCENIWMSIFWTVKTFGWVKCWGVQHLVGSNVEMSNIWVGQMFEVPTFEKSSKSRGKIAKTFGRVKCWDVQHLKKQMFWCPTFGRVKCWRFQHLVGSNVEVSNILKNKCFDVQHFVI